MSSQESKSTDNHVTIKNWAEERYGEPALVEGIVDIGNAGEMLRIYFPGHSEERLKSISWELFYEIFDKNNLMFLYKEKTVEGEQSRLCKFISKT